MPVDKQINEFPEITSLPGTYFVLVDDGAGNYKKIRGSNLGISGGGGGGDTTPPTVVSVTAISASVLRYVYSETTTMTLAGHSWKKNGSAWSASSIASVSSTTWDVTMATAASSGDTLLRSYDSTTGATVDGFANELLSYTDSSVTNSIGGGYQTESTTFFAAVVSAGGTITTPFKDAWDAFVVSQNGTNGSWTDMQAAWPYFGGNLAGAAINAKNPGTFDITWQGTPTISANGVQFNGTSNYAKTGWIGNSGNVSQVNGVSFGFYGRIDRTAGAYDMGMYESGKDYLCLPNADGTYQVQAAGGGFTLAHATLQRTDQFNFVVKGPGASQAAYRESVTVATASAYTLDDTGTKEMYIGACNDTTIVYSANEHAFGFIGKGLNSSQITKLVADVDTLMTALSRNV